jgi:2-polyprenyl-3-methyl-5-hydroxy-6-metoxy-1,4-benzoquinol methylase
MDIKKQTKILDPNHPNQHEVVWTKDSSTRLWNYYSSSDAHRTKYFGYRCGQEVARLISRKLFHKVTKILDYSCGRGDLLYNCIPFLKSKHEIYACDMSIKSIEETSNKLKNISNFFGATVIKNLPSQLPSRNFDLVVATEVLEHLNDNELERTLEDIARIVKIGGYIFITTPFREDLESEKTICPDCGCIFHRWQHQRSWSLDSMQSILRRFKFETVECKTIQWGSWPIKLYTHIFQKPGNGMYCIAKMTSQELSKK